MEAEQVGWVNLDICNTSVPLHLLLLVCLFDWSATEVSWRRLQGPMGALGDGALPGPCPRLER